MKKSLFAFVLIAVFVQFSAAADLVLPHVTVGSTVYLRNDSEGLALVMIGDTNYFLVPHQLLGIPAIETGHLKVNLPDGVSAWSEVEDVPFQAVAPATRFTLNATKTTGLVLVNPTSTSVYMNITVYGARNEVVSYFPGQFIANGHWVIMIGDLMRGLPEGQYVTVVEAVNPVVVSAATYRNSAWRSVIVTSSR